MQSWGYTWDGEKNPICSGLWYINNKLIQILGKVFKDIKAWYYLFLSCLFYAWVRSFGLENGLVFIKSISSCCNIYSIKVYQTL